MGGSDKYTNGDGNDSIVGFNTKSTLSISGSYSTAKSGSNILVTVGDGKITLVGASSLSSVNILPTLKPNPFTEGNDTYSNSVSSVSLNTLGVNDLIYNTGVNVTIYGSTGDDLVNNQDCRRWFYQDEKFHGYNLQCQRYQVSYQRFKTR